VDTPATALQHMRIDHGGADVLVPQEFLHGTDVIAIFQQVRGKTVSERMAATALIETCLAYRVLYRLLEHRFSRMMSAFSP
jgi:hypothetical protein